MGFWFTSIPDGDLHAPERASILALKGMGFRLRNKVHNFGNLEPSPFDRVMRVEDQEHWATGAAHYSVSGFARRADELDDECAGATTKLRRSVSSELHDAVLDDLAFIAAHVLPNAVETEREWWTVSDCPSTSGKRTFTLNIGRLEFMYGSRRPVPFLEGIEPTRPPRPVTTVNLAPEGLGDESISSTPETGDSHWYSFAATDEIPIDLEFGRAHYPLTDTDSWAVRTGEIRTLAKAVPAFLPDAREFAIRLMRDSRANLFRRFHSPALTRDVLRRALDLYG